MESNRAGLVLGSEEGAKMKVILTQEVKGRGGEGDVVEVARGFAVNYLFPNKMAVEATSGNLKQLEQRMRNIRKREEARVAEASAFVAAIDGKEVVIPVKVGEAGRLYGSITSQMIEEAISEQLGAEIDRRKMDSPSHIKEIGEHRVVVRVYKEVKAEVIVRVVDEDSPDDTSKEQVGEDNPGDTSKAQADEEVSSESPADTESS